MSDLQCKKFIEILHDFEKNNSVRARETRKRKLGGIVNEKRIE